jgi:hypothetical protein
MWIACPRSLIGCQGVGYALTIQDKIVVPPKRPIIIEFYLFFGGILPHAVVYDIKDPPHAAHIICQAVGLGATERAPQLQLCRHRGIDRKGQGSRPGQAAQTVRNLAVPQKARQKGQKPQPTGPAFWFGGQRLVVDLERRRFTPTISISLSGDDTYHYEVRRAGKTVFKGVSPKTQDDQAPANRVLNIPPKVASGGYDELVLDPIAGNIPSAVQHIFL